MPDVDAAVEYALHRLSSELTPDLHYHSLAHTQHFVVPACEQLAALEGVDSESLALLKTAAWFHDIGFVKQRADHEIVGVRIAAVSLPNFGYTPDQIEQVGGMIMATRLPQSPRNLLEQLLADGDLAVLGHAAFFACNEALRRELAFNGSLFTDQEWYSAQYKFLTEHQYFTNAARQLYGEQKARYMARMKTLAHL